MANKFNRHAGNQNRPRFLISCEGAKTEPNFIKNFCHYHKIPTHYYEILKCPYTTPREIFDYARTQFGILNKEQEKYNKFTDIVCIFDRDEHISYKSTIQEIIDHNQADNKPPITPIVSNPCFEIWYLMHFMEVHHLYERDEVIKILKKEYLPNYEKNTPNMYEQIMGKEKEDLARKNYERHSQHIHRAMAGETPFCNMVELCQKLLSVKPY